MPAGEFTPFCVSAGVGAKTRAGGHPDTYPSRNFLVRRVVLLGGSLGCVERRVEAAMGFGVDGDGGGGDGDRRRAGRIEFRYAPTLRAAFNDGSAVKIVQGPVESGKTVWLCAEIYRLMCTVPRCRDGVRRSRVLVIRTTEGELVRGIMRTWKDWFPEEVYGPIQGSMPAVHYLRFLDVECEVEFFAFEDDSEPVLRKLRSTEYTMVAFNEAQFTPLTLLLMAKQRAGRYPRKEDCPGFDRRKRVVMDMNAPRTSTHWALYMRGDAKLPADMPSEERRRYRKPKGWRFFVQPPAVRPVRDVLGEIVDFELHPLIENLPFQKGEEILSMCQNGDLDDIRRDYMNEMVQVKHGKPRYPGFKRGWHVARDRLTPAKGVPVVIGYDPGLSGAAVFFQRINDQWRGLAEMVADGDTSLQSAKEQGERMLAILRDRFPWHKDAGVVCWGDPYGSWGTVDKNTTFYRILGEMGLDFHSPAVKDNPTLRHQVGSKILREGSYGDPKLLLCPVGCPGLIDALDGGAVMRQVRREGSMVTQDEILKNRHSHICEAAEYAWWGGGESYSIVQRPEEERIPVVHQTMTGWSPFSRTRSRGSVWGRR